MEGKIDLRDSVYAVCTKYPEIKDLLAEMGFQDIAKPGALNTIGRLMTIPRGASMRGIDLAAVIRKLKEAGFEVAAPEGSTGASAASPAAFERSHRMDLLKGYVSRLSRGDSLEEVRKDFVENFQSVDAAEIAGAEQSLIQSGTPVEEVQRLCDVHSALFHGATREEQIANAETAVQASAARAAAAKAASTLPKMQPEGHPVNVFMAENRLIESLLQQTQEDLASAAGEDDVAADLKSLHVLSGHYARKGDLLYPLLKSRYDVTGPADVMWAVDDEIRDELKVLTSSFSTMPDFRSRAEKVLSRAEEMIYKENNILLPLCIEHFTKQDWMSIYLELSGYEPILAEKAPVWEEAEALREKPAARQTDSNDDFISLGSGHMKREQIAAVLDTIPMELSFIDEQDINRYFNGGRKVFKRPDAAIDRKVYACHPPKFAAMARQIIDELKSGEQDSVDVWMTKGGKPLLVRYMAVRDAQKNYIGTLECVQNMSAARDHFSAK